ncbi:peptidase metallopeptidase [Stanieria cyanosphaera PCC 7437]|uniref:Peptidase metallopeptidase n=1 Tax=Stanieria cyanosphaera (strain ATCC 29371 / PCC 7437) TaxID=111780 RepID=K9XXS9_STAC7|nr:peptidase [Stanieria cyanosphaera]AFZ36911.1 peptidase metallopeptidase [Stanieria cyanosphaera PCC 7437]
MTQISLLIKLIFARGSLTLFAIATSLIIIISTQLNVTATFPPESQSFAQNQLPPLKTHPLPSVLASWEDREHQGDYFKQIKTTPLGYLIWSEFPIKVFLEKPLRNQHHTADQIRFAQWVEAVRKAIAEWNLYLPLWEVENPQLADIIIKRSQTNREFKLNQATGQYNIPRASTAQTNYEFYLKPANPAIVSHRMTIEISPNLSQLSTLAATRHELGHALGIWGHSNQETDALYFSQVRNYTGISARDLNTLKKIYQQPTKLGWSIILNPQS